MEKDKIKNFTDLLVWQNGHNLVLDIYRLTKKFPQEEKFGLADQVRRAAVSITSNIAEGFGRIKYNDKAHFYTIALGSVYEVQNQILIAKDVGYITGEDCDLLMNSSIDVGKMCSGLIRKTRSFDS
jgi:four helix bundle protein